MERSWVRATSLETLKEKGRFLLRHEGKQVAIFHTPGGVFACSNRCPHEGYPLMEGSLDDGPDGAGCRLTCNWHSWRFNLRDGSTEEGDRVRVYPVRTEAGEVLLDLSDPPAEQRISEALTALKDALRRRDRGRIAREIARLENAGGNPLSAVTHAIRETAPRFAYGMSHAQAAANDWLALRADYARTPAERLVPLVEIVDHLIDDSLSEAPRPFAQEAEPFDAANLEQAILASDDEAASRLIRGALAQGLGWPDMEPAFARAALHHYADFGHSAIYTYKTGRLLERLGHDALEPLALLLTRALCEAWREDLIPEFRAYKPALEAWDGAGRTPVSSEDFRGLGVKQALRRALESSGKTHALYQALLGAAAYNFLHFDLSLERRVDLKPSESKTWLSFTHAITFANAGRNLAERYPDLWPAVLLQLACFVGRNAGAVSNEPLEREWAPKDGKAFLDGAFKMLFDHGNPEPIVTAHLVKLSTAIKEEIAAAPQASWRDTLLAALARFLANPPHRPQVLRLATQAIRFVEQES